VSITPELLASTKIHEGRKLRAYQDTVGVWTIGYGTNLQELEIDDELATRWLYDMLRKALISARGYPWFNNLNQARKDVIVEMIYNLGLSRFDKFKDLKAALAESRFDVAADEMLDSKWADDVGDGPGGKDDRAERLARQMRAGEYWQ
jgi:lysozyme